MTGLEDSVRGKAFYKTESGEYKELGVLESAEIEDIEESKNIITDTEVEFECTINDKDTIKKLKQLFKTDKDKKAERRFNKNNFTNFIKRKRGKGR